MYKGCLAFQKVGYSPVDRTVVRNKLIAGICVAISLDCGCLQTVLDLRVECDHPMRRKSHEAPEPKAQNRCCVPNQARPSNDHHVPRAIASVIRFLASGRPAPRS